MRLRALGIRKEWSEPYLQDQLIGLHWIVWIIWGHFNMSLAAQIILRFLFSQSILPTELAPSLI